jgi:hypothetical protein
MIRNIQIIFENDLKVFWGLHIVWVLLLPDIRRATRFSYVLFRGHRHWFTHNQERFLRSSSKYKQHQAYEVADVFWSFKREVSFIISENPMIPVNGIYNSWETSENNRLLSLSAASAVFYASLSSSSILERVNNKPTCQAYISRRWLSCMGSFRWKKA